MIIQLSVSPSPRVARCYNGWSLNIMSNLQIDREPNELGHGPCQRGGRPGAFSKTEFRSRGHAPIPNLFRNHHSVVCEIQHRVQVLLGSQTIAASQCVCASLAGQQAPQSSPSTLPVILSAPVSFTIGV